MNKALVVMGVCIVASAVAVYAVPKAVESAAPAAEVVYTEKRSYRDTIQGSGELCYEDQSLITSALPLVIDKFEVKEGEYVSVGDTIATIDRDSSAALIESLGQVKALAVSSVNLSTAVSLLPDKVTSEYSGRVIAVAGNGKAVQSGSAIAEIANGDKLTITTAISENDIAKVKLGQQAQFTLTAYPNDIFFGTVTNIAGAARNQYNGAVLETVVDITITPEKNDERFKSGLSADVVVCISDPRDICVLPYSAIGQDEAGEFIYVYEDGKAVRHDIFTGVEFSDVTEIRKGVSEQDIVIKDPQNISDKNFIKIN